MKKIVSAVLAAVLLFSLMSFTAFAGESDRVIDDLRTDTEYYSRFAGSGITLNVYNWGEYISDGSDGILDTVAAFEDLTGIRVNYTTFASNEEMYAKIKSGGGNYDVIIPSDYMIARMINEGMLAELDFENIPNLQYIDEAYLGMGHDPEGKYSVPYTWGMTGLIYNSAQIEEDEMTSWTALWDERYIGDILMFSNSRDAFAIAESILGYSLNTNDKEQLEEAADLLKEQKLLVQAYVMDEIFNKMEGGEALVAPYYAGDALTMMDENPDLAFVYPEEGVNIFVDAMVIPASSDKKEAAEMFINFMAEPVIAAANCEYIGYFCPVTEAWDYLDFEYFEPVYPSDEVIEKAESFSALSEESNLLMDALWTEILSYNEDSNRWVGPVFLVFGLAASLGINIYRHIKKKRSVEN